MRLALSGLTSLLLLAACGSDNPNAPGDGIVCTAEARAGLVVELRDAASKASIVAGAVVVASEGAYSDTLRTADNQTLFGVFERPGTYTLRVTTPAHGSTTRGGITVTRDACHVIPVRVTIELVQVAR